MSYIAIHTEYNERYSLSRAFLRLKHPDKYRTGFIWDAGRTGRFYNVTVYDTELCCERVVLMNQTGRDSIEESLEMSASVKIKDT